MDTQQATQVTNPHSEPLPEVAGPPEIPRLRSWTLARPAYYPISLEVGDRHIDRMNYFFNEAPMCDSTTQNAVALAMRDVVSEQCRVTVSVSGGEAIARVADATCRLGTGIAGWLGNAFTGGEVKPFRQTVWLPVDALVASTPLLSVFSPPEEQTE